MANIAGPLYHVAEYASSRCSPPSPGPLGAPGACDSTTQYENKSLVFVLPFSQFSCFPVGSDGTFPDLCFLQFTGCFGRLKRVIRVPWKKEQTRGVSRQNPRDTDLGAERRPPRDPARGRAQDEGPVMTILIFRWSSQQGSGL